jgi:putative peptidoglycan lipid II flippase
MLSDEYRSIFIVVLGYSAASITGFLRQVVIAQQLGVGRDADILLIAFALPEFIFIALPIVLNPAFIPLFTENRFHLGEKAAWKLARSTSIGLSLLMIVLSVVTTFAAPSLLNWLAPGFSASENEIAVRSLRLMLPSLTFMALANLSSAVMQVYRQFAPAAWMTAFYNLVFTAALLTLPHTSLITRASWGVTLGAVIALTAQIPILRHYYRRSSNQLISSQPNNTKPAYGFSQVLFQALPLFAGYSVHHLILLVDRAMATTLAPGSVSSLNYASHLALVIGQVSGLAVSTVIFPKLTEQIAVKDFKGARSRLAQALQLVWLIALPASVSLVILREPIIRTLFEGRAFGPTATQMVSAPLIWYSLAVLADALCQPFWRLIYAQKKTWTVFVVNGLQTGIRFLANLILIKQMGYTGLALSALIGLTVQVFLLGWLSYRRLGKYWSADWLKSIRETAFSTLAAAIVLSLLVFFLPFEPFWLASISGLVGVGTFFIMLQYQKILRRQKRGN